MLSYSRLLILDAIVYSQDQRSREYVQARCVYRVAATRASGGLRAAGISRSGRIFMAEKIFYHNNTEIRTYRRVSSLFSFAREDTG